MGIRSTMRRLTSRYLGSWVGLCVVVVLLEKVLQQQADRARAALLVDELRSTQQDLLTQTLDVRDAPTTQKLAYTKPAVTRPALSSGAEVECVDHHDACAYWAAHGQCDANAEYMLVTCVLSCDGACKRARVLPSPASSPAATTTLSVPIPPTTSSGPPPSLNSAVRPPSSPPPPPAFHLPPAPPRAPCVDADRSSLERHWGQGVVDIYRRMTPPAACGAASTTKLQCDETTGLYCQAKNIQLELYAKGDPHFQIDCAGASLSLFTENIGFGFHVQSQQQWAVQLTARKLPSFIDESAGSRPHPRKVLVVHRIKPQNLFHHFEQMTTAYITLAVRGWEDIPAKDIDVMLVDVSAFRRVRPPVKRSREETMTLAVWSMFGSVRSTDPAEWLSTPALTLKARMEADASTSVPQGRHPACNREACRLMLSDAVFAITGFTRLVYHLSPTDKSMQSQQSLESWHAATAPRRECGPSTVLKKAVERMLLYVTPSPVRGEEQAEFERRTEGVSSVARLRRQWQSKRRGGFESVGSAAQLSDIHELQVTVICRGQGAFRGTRLMLNQAEVIEALGTVEVSNWSGGMTVTQAVMEEMTWSEQLSLVAQSDVLVGMHGAGLTHLAWLPETAGVVELMNYGIENDVNQEGIEVYEKLAGAFGLAYSQWHNTDPKNHEVVDKKRPGIMANTRVNTVELCEVVRVILEQLVSEWHESSSAPSSHRPL